MPATYAWKWVVALFIAAVFAYDFNLDVRSPAFIMGLVDSVAFLAILTMYIRGARALKASGKSGWSWPNSGWFLLLFPLGLVEAFVSSQLHIDPYGSVARQGYWAVLIVYMVVMIPTPVADGKKAN